MNVSKNDIEFYIKREFSDFLERMTDDEINEITHWCDALIRQRQKIENDIIRNIEIALSEAKDKIKELYHDKIDVSFIATYDKVDFSDSDDNFEYTFEMAIKKLYPDFPILENLDSFDRKNLIDCLIDSLITFGKY